MIRSLSIQVVIFILIFMGISWFKEINMMPKREPIADNTIQLQTIMGDIIPISANKKQTVLYFFAPWCHVCEFSISNLQTFYQQNEEVDVIAIALDYVDSHEIEKYATKHQLTFPIALGNGKVKKSFKISAYPSYYVINADNTIIARSIGYSTEFGLYLRNM